MKQHLFTAVLALVFGFVGAGLWSVSGLGQDRTRDYLIANPDILPKMAEELQRRESEQQLGEVRDEVAAPFPGAVLGNPNGTRTLVEFTDYACTYCRASQADVARLIRSDPQLKVVIREWPIFEGSEEAARMALAAARQGRYAAFHNALFELGPPSAATIAAAAQSAGLDLESARTIAASKAVTDELARNMAMARQLGFSGTPSWVAGGQVIQGAVGYDALARAIQGDDEA